MCVSMDDNDDDESDADGDGRCRERERGRERDADAQFICFNMQSVYFLASFLGFLQLI